VVGVVVVGFGVRVVVGVGVGGSGGFDVRVGAGVGVAATVIVVIMVVVIRGCYYYYRCRCCCWPCLFRGHACQSYHRQRPQTRVCGTCRLLLSESILFNEITAQMYKRDTEESNLIG